MTLKVKRTSLFLVAGWTAVALLVTTQSAAAHPGHDSMSGFVTGIQHPLSGIDHFLAMIAVGLWAGLCGGRREWLWPATFVTSMIAGSAIGLYATTTTSVEWAILESVMTLGLATALRLRAPLILGGIVIAAFGFAHGFAHGREMPHSANGLDFAAGFTVATSMLHLVGVSAAATLRRLKIDVVTRFAGIGIVIAGIGLIVGV